jgi:hypothetical protein
VKICPTCNQNYTDDSLNFCLSDGAVLTQSDGGNTIQPTVFIPQAQMTNPNQGFKGQTNQIPNQNFGNQNQPNNWSNPQPNYIPPIRKSRAGFWILGIVGAIILFSVIGFVGLVALVATNTDKDETNSGDSTSFTNSKYKTILKEDFSDWRKDSTDDVKTDYTNNEYIMTSKQAGYFYVFVTSKGDYKSTNASTKVTVRNVNGTTTPLGYGLLVHSNPNVALSSDYAFLIDSTTQSYRIAMHTANKEISLIKWTKFAAIHSGTQANDVEVKDENGKMTLFINGQTATTIQNTTSLKDGIAGIYAGDGIPVAFSNMKLGK